MIVTYCAKTTSTSVGAGQHEVPEHVEEVRRGRPLIDGSLMPLAGNRLGIGPTPTLKMTSRIMPSQKVGIDHRVSETPEEIRSNGLPWPPSAAHARATARARPIPASRCPSASTVGQSREAIREATDCWNCQEWPSLPCSVSLTKSTNRSHSGRSSPS